MIGTRPCGLPTARQRQRMMELVRPILPRRCATIKLKGVSAGPTRARCDLSLLAAETHRRLVARLAFSSFGSCLAASNRKPTRRRIQSTNRRHPSGRQSRSGEHSSCCSFGADRQSLLEEPSNRMRHSCLVQFQWSSSVCHCSGVMVLCPNWPSGPIGRLTRL